MEFDFGWEEEEVGGEKGVQEEEEEEGEKEVGVGCFPNHIHAVHW